ncbi:hypothetical protein [Mycobacterium sp. DL592]|uniref:hypothetical protein n=1 Tax=Mycobacterium sp. DL592 TaxID=2675524 RepID=UPI001AAF35EC|nr:hypothetical protein [Mycobacterium sp. DL592]
MVTAGAASLRLDTGQSVVLGPPLSGATGEGTIFGLASRPDWAAKVFHPTLTGLEDKLAKVAAMVQSPPAGAMQPDGLVVLTWPLHVLFDASCPVGYVMPRIDTATSVELHTISNPSNRRDPLPKAPQWTRYVSWGHLVNVAANLCLAVEVVHRVDAVIGDFQERNILVADTTEVTLVDCDSMQFSDRAGRRYLCAVGRPEFTAPELTGVDLRVQARQQTADLFALAVHIHQLLLEGNHPFMRGEWRGPGHQPDALTLARSGEWAGGPNSRLHTHPLAPSVRFLPDELQQLFFRAFTAGAQDPGLRPAAWEWRAALGRIRLARCVRNPDHQHPVNASVCPWCRIDDERQARRGRQNSSASISNPQNSQGSFRTGPSRVMPIAPRTTLAGSASRPHRSALAPRHKAILAVLAVTVAIVVALSAYIVWALLTGATTFGSAGRGSDDLSIIPAQQQISVQCR